MEEFCNLVVGGLPECMGFMKKRRRNQCEKYMAHNAMTIALFDEINMMLLYKPARME
jgi:hypothetical protein